MTVRHPYERVVSAYRDKVQNADKLQFYRIIGKQAKKNYRELPDNLEKDREVLARISDDIVNSRDFSNLDVNNPFNNPMGPTFTEFSKSVLLDNISDMHWASYQSYCAPCFMNYSAIVRFETLAQDNMYILQKTGLNVAEWPDHTNPTLDGATEEKTWKSYFRELDWELLELYQIKYKLDCEIFQYDCSITEFLN